MHKIRVCYRCKLLALVALFGLIVLNAQDPEPEWRAYEGNPVLTVGEAGTWDAGALGSMTVLKVGDTFHMYYEAWGVRSTLEWDEEEYFSLQIGHATSDDGLHWIKDDENNPVIPKQSNTINLAISM